MISRAVIARHPQYAFIISKYRESFIANGGKVNEKLFWETYIRPVVANYGLTAWYQFIQKFRKQTGLIAAQVSAANQVGPKTAEEGKLVTAMMTNEAATQLGINSALTLGAKALEALLSDSEALAKMSPKERADMLFKAMKAQDSRIHAIGKLKEDNREEKKFNRVFGSGAL